MTFHDDTESSAENAAYHSAKQIQLWLRTIAPLYPLTSNSVVDSLNKMAIELGWEVVDDEYLGTVIK